MENNQAKLEDFKIVTSLTDLGITPNEQNQSEDQQEQSNVNADPIAERYYELLKEEQLIYVPNDYKFDGTFKSLKELQELTYKQQVQLAQEQLMNSMPEKLKTIVQAGLQGVDDLDSLISISKNKYFDAPIDTEDAQKRLIKQELSGTLPGDAIDDLIDTYIEKGKLKAEAERLLGKRKADADNRIAQMQKEAEVRKQQEQIEYQKFNENLTSEIKAQKWNPKKEEVVMRELTSSYQGVPLVEAKLNSILSNPAHLIHLAEFLSFYDGKEFKLNDYKKVETQQMQQIQDKWASKLSDTNPTLNQRQHPRSNVDVSDFQLYVG